MIMPTLIVIGGPTASGKTDLAIEVAQKLETEILSFDSRQCYKELSVGVAKPSTEQLKMIAHHFVDSHSIYDAVNAGEFERYGMSVLQKLFAKSERVVAVGGSGLYIRALCEGLDEMPTVDEQIRQEVEDQYRQYGLGWLQKSLLTEDPLFENYAEISNPNRLMRALSFIRSNHQSILTFRKRKKAA
jgi:tRNA delta(2)-isopentenylpyrophosphate transferase